jgi:hypothetical protein
MRGPHVRTSPGHRLTLAFALVDHSQLVVLLHGAAATRKSFALQIEALKVCSLLVRLAPSLAHFYLYLFIYFWSSCT